MKGKVSRLKPVFRMKGSRHNELKRGTFYTGFVCYLIKYAEGLRPRAQPLCYPQGSKANLKTLLNFTSEQGRKALVVGC